MEDIINEFVGLKQFKFDIKKLLAHIQTEIDVGNEFEDAYETYLTLSDSYQLWINILKAKRPQYKVLADLVQFYIDHNKNDKLLLLDDLLNDENLGFAIRQKKIVPVILDAGFSNNVSIKHY